jgi:hypothetical protein
LISEALPAAISASRSGALSASFCVWVFACIQDVFPRGDPNTRFGARRVGNVGGMQLSLLLIVIGIILAILVNYGLGLICILIGLVLLIWPRLRTTA